MALIGPTFARYFALRSLRAMVGVFMTVLGGFAAPLFLWLAGLAVVLASNRFFQLPA